VAELLADRRPLISRDTRWAQALAAALDVGAAAMIQLRWSCSLIDGMVAIEGGRRTNTGDVFNDRPDHIADVFPIAGAGHAAPVFFHMPRYWFS
jgi:phosphatidylglycerophosphate synthase